MAALTDNEKREIARQFMEVDQTGLGAFGKPDLRAAITAIDTAADAADNGLLAGVDASFRTQLTTQQRRVLKRLVLAARYA